MARTRSIKPGFFDNDILGDLPPLTRLLFIGLWCIADREGRLEDRPKRIKKALLGYDDVDTDAVDEMLAALHSAGFIYRYRIQGEEYIQIVNFSKHQNPHVKEKPSEILPPHMANTIDETACGADMAHSTGQAPDKYDTSTEEAAPITVNLLPSTGNLSPTTPPSGDGGGENKEEPQTGESLKVQTARRAGRAKPADHSMTPTEKRFNEFWTAYPKKVGKKAAEAIWKRLKPDAELHDRIMTAIGRARVTEQWTRDGGRYIPNPATWLNQGRWDDEYGEVEVNGNAKHSGNYERNDADERPTENAGEPKLNGFKRAWYENDDED